MQATGKAILETEYGLNIGIFAGEAPGQHSFGWHVEIWEARRGVCEGAFR